MSDDQQRFPGGRSPIDEIVRIQQRMARRWSLHVVGCIDRLQCGNLEITPWLESNGRYVADTADQVSDLVQAFFNLGGGW
jgi:hypothetical protein